jgi:pimeloyl-ACP methyl ester carboxylesterase
MMHYRYEGSGNQTLVLIHGFCENNTCFNKQVLFFKDHYKVLLVDLPGFGESIARVGISMDDMALEIKQVLDSLGIDKCVMLGHSMGGYVSLAFAENFPTYLVGFGLIHSVATADKPERKEKRDQVVSFIEKHGKEPFIKNFIPTLFYQTGLISDITETVNQALVSSQIGIIEAAKAMKSRPDRCHVLTDANVPVFFGIGRHDSLIPEKLMLEQSSYCKIAKVAYLSESGHMGMVEEGDKLNQEILSFMDLVAHTSN